MNFLFYRLISPRLAMLLVVGQVFGAYLGFLDYWALRYGMKISWGPMIMWVWSAISFSIGAYYLKHAFQGGVDPRCLVDELNIISISKIRIISTIVSVFGLVSTFIIYKEIGGIPLVEMVVYSVDIAELVGRQEDALPGIFGLHRIIVSTLSVCIAIQIALSVVVNSGGKFLIVLFFILNLVFSTMNGKREELIISFVLYVIVAIISSSCSDYSKKINGIEVTGNKKLNLIKFGGVFILIGAILKGITFVRLDTVGAAEDANYEIFRYISLPLINLEYLWQSAGIFGGEVSFLKPFALLVPAKLFVDRDYFGYVLPEVTSPMGYFISAWMCWGGIFGAAIMSFFIGVLCQYFYGKVLNSFSALIIYGFIFWDILVSHTHNHFLTNVYLPAQCIVILLIVKLSKRRELVL